VSEAKQLAPILSATVPSGPVPGRTESKAKERA
jgi:hypothetical protein